MSHDGQNILLVRFANGARAGVWLVSLSGDQQPKPLLQSSTFDEGAGTFSPDGRFVAYVSNESGHDEVYVQTDPLSGRKWTISSGGGSFPLWRDDGKELFYITSDGRVMAVEIKPGGEFESGVPQQLFQTSIKINSGSRPYDVTRDGARFLIKVAAEANNPAPMTIVLNWPSDLKH